MYRTPPCVSTANRWSFSLSLFSRAAIRHTSAAPCSPPVDRTGSVDTTSSPVRMRSRPHAAPASVGANSSNTCHAPIVPRRSTSMARVTTPLWMVANPWSFWLEAMAGCVRPPGDSDHQVVRPSGFRSPSCPPFEIFKLSALRDSDHQVVRPSGFVGSPSCPPSGIQIPKLSALRCLPLSSPACPAWREIG